MKRAYTNILKGTSEGVVWLVPHCCIWSWKTRYKRGGRKYFCYFSWELSSGHGGWVCLTGVFKSRVATMVRLILNCLALPLGSAPCRTDSETPGELGLGFPFSQDSSLLWYGITLSSSGPEALSLEGKLVFIPEVFSPNAGLFSLPSWPNPNPQCFVLVRSHWSICHGTCQPLPLSRVTDR